MVSKKEIVLTLNDILLELNDLGIRTRVEDINTYGPSDWSPRTSYCKVTIVKSTSKETILIKGSEVSDVIERLYYFMKENGWSMWIKAHLYNDYEYNNGYLSFKHLLPGRGQYEYKNRLEDYFDIFRYQLECGMKSIVVNFEKVH